MPNGTDKAAVFTAAILDGARAEAMAVTAAVEAAERAALDEYAAAQSGEAERRAAAARADARGREEKRLTAAALKCRRELLQYREDCARETLERVGERLAAYPEHPEYADTLKTLLFKAVGALPGSGVTVYLRPDDLRFADALAREVPNTPLTFAQGSFALGGLAAEGGGMRADLTFDSALEDLSGRFSELTGFDVEDRHGD